MSHGRNSKLLSRIERRAVLLTALLGVLGLASAAFSSSLADVLIVAAGCIACAALVALAVRTI